MWYSLQPSCRGESTATSRVLTDECAGAFMRTWGRSPQEVHHGPIADWGHQPCQPRAEASGPAPLSLSLPHSCYSLVSGNLWDPSNPDSLSQDFQCWKAATMCPEFSVFLVSVLALLPTIPLMGGFRPSKNLLTDFWWCSDALLSFSSVALRVIQMPAGTSSAQRAIMRL